MCQIYASEFMHQSSLERNIKLIFDQWISKKQQHQLELQNEKVQNTNLQKSSMELTTR